MLGVMVKARVRVRVRVGVRVRARWACDLDPLTLTSVFLSLVPSRPPLFPLMCDPNPSPNMDFSNPYPARHFLCFVKAWLVDSD